MAKFKNQRFDKDQIVMARQMGQSIFETAGVFGSYCTSLQWLVSSKSGPRKDNQ